MIAVDGHIRVDTIMAGKFRRYNKLPLIQQLLRLRTIVFPNVIDGAKLIVGTLQSIVKLLVWRPDVVFSKGGFVCLPVGVAAYILRIPVVIHDSDAHPGLTSRILARWAVSIATGAPLKYYSYPKKKTTYIGIPVASTAKPLSLAKQRDAKKLIGVNEHEPLVVITGGGLGAKSINDSVVKVLPDLLTFSSVVLVAGKANVDHIKTQVKAAPNLKLYGYVASDAMQQMLGAADMVVTRAGATTLLELAALAKPSIIIPNEYLTGGHQVKNARVYEQAKAAIIIDDTELQSRPLVLVDTINATLLHKPTLERLSKNIHGFAKPNAAKDMAAIIVKAAS